MRTLVVAADTSWGFLINSLPPSLNTSHGTLPRSAAETLKRGETKQMKNMKQLLNNLVVEESGQDLIEYALVAALVGLGAVAAMKGLSNSIGNTFNGIGTQLTTSV